MMQVTSNDADYLGLGPDTGIGSDRYHFIDKPHQFVRRVLTEHADMRAILEQIGRMNSCVDSDCSIAIHAAARIAREALASLHQEGK